MCSLEKDAKATSNQCLVLNGFVFLGCGGHGTLVTTQIHPCPPRINYFERFFWGSFIGRGDTHVPCSCLTSVSFHVRNRLQLRDLNEGLQMAAIAADDTGEVSEILVPEMLERLSGNGCNFSLERRKGDGDIIIRNIY